MPLFRLTQKLAPLVPTAKLAPPSVPVPPEHEWFTSLFFVEGKKCVLWAQRTTLLGFVRRGVTAAELREFPALFRRALWATLGAMGLSESVAAPFGVDEPASYGPTNDRRILGSMNDYRRMFEGMVERRGGLARADIPVINVKLNDAPMSVIGMESAIWLLRAMSGNHTGA